MTASMWAELEDERDEARSRADAAERERDTARVECARLEACCERLARDMEGALRERDAMRERARLADGRAEETRLDCDRLRALVSELKAENAQLRAARRDA